MLFAERVEELLRQQHHVVLAFAQRRHAQAQHVEAVVEIFAEAALLHRFFQIHVGGGKHAYIQLDQLAAAHALQRAFLQEAQQAGLCVQRQIAHFVEKDGATRGCFEMADAARIGAGECAALVAEQFRLHQVRWQRAAIDRSERPIGACRQAVQGPRGNLLAGARFAGDQHGQLHWCVLAHAGHHRADRGTAAGHADVARLSRTRLVAAHPGERLDQTVDVHRRGEVFDARFKHAIDQRLMHRHGRRYERHPRQPGVIGHELSHGLGGGRIAVPEVGQRHHRIVVSHADAALSTGIGDADDPSRIGQPCPLFAGRLTKPDDASPGFLPHYSHGSLPQPL